jgi:hypothetical protein
MKRRLGALIVATAMGGCMSANHSSQTGGDPTVRASGQFTTQTVPGVVGPYGEPVQMAAPYTASAPSWLTARRAEYMMSQSVPLDMVNGGLGVLPAAAQLPGMPAGVMPPGGGMMPPPGGMPISNGSNTIMVPRSTMGMMSGMNGAAPQGNMAMPPGMMPPPPGSMQYSPYGPFPGGIPPGAVAALGAITGHGLGQGPGYTIGRTQVRFVGPSGMKIAWQTQGADGKPGYSAPMVEAPGRYNFLQASIYGLKLSSIEKRPGLEVYPTLEVVPGNHKTEAFLAHSAVPLLFTDEDFQEVAEGKYLVKVIYLPDPQFQELAAAGTDEIVSTRLEPGADPVLEAQRRGSILLVIRMGNVDQEAPNTPPLTSRDGPGGAGMMPPGMMPHGMMAMPGMMPPGMMPPNMTGPTPGPSGPSGGPSIPPYLRGGPGPVPSGPPAPSPSHSPLPGAAPMPNGPAIPPMPPAFPGGPTSRLPDASEFRQAGSLPPTWPPSAPPTPAGLATQGSGAAH